MILCALVAGVACTSREGAAPAEPPVSAAEPPAPAASPTATPAPEPAAKPAAASAVFRTALPHVEPARRFEQVASFGALERGLQLARLGDDVLAAFGGPEVVILEPDGRVTSDPQWVRGVESHSPELLDGNMLYWYPVALGGGWPEQTYLTVGLGSAARSGGGPPELYARRQGRWHRVATSTKQMNWYPIAFGPWKDGSLLALQRFEPRFSTDGDGDVEPPAAEVRAFEAAVKKRKSLVVISGAPKAPTLPVRELRAFASLPTGELFAAGVEDGRTVMVHHDGTRARRVELPRGTGVNVQGMHALAADRVFAWGSAAAGSKGYLARWDGAAWRELGELPCSGAIVGLDVDGEGTVYFTCEVPSQGKSGNTALLRLRGDVLDELGVPTSPDEGPLAVLARGPDDVWITVGAWADGEGGTLWHTGASGPPTALRSSSDTNAVLLEWDEPRPVGRDCWIAWVPLRDGADPDKAAMAIRDAEGLVAEVRWVRVQGSTQWGVWVSETPKVMRAALAKVVARLGKDAGEPICNERPWVEPP
ncbi:MAG: hypothetical protein K1X88_22025 [Nannocystaceae bacterium]|nr:hypothetical protein [Nannocystaceae bacterium]